MDYDFSRLTRAQEWLLTLKGFQFDRTSTRRGPKRATVELLIKRGLVIEHKHPHWPSSYEVPLAVHMAWCEYCSGLEA